MKSWLHWICDPFKMQHFCNWSKWKGFIFSKVSKITHTLNETLKKMSTNAYTKVIRKVSATPPTAQCRYRYIYLFFCLLSLFKKNESRLMWSPYCLCVREFPLINYHGAWAHLIGVLHKSLPSVSVSVLLLSLLGKSSIKCIPPFIARQRLSKHIPIAMNTHNNKRIVGRVCLWVCLCTSLLC
jgi:hypothetical protein